MNRWECQFCDDEVHHGTVSDLKESGKAHVLNSHFDELEELFREKYAGKDCKARGCSDGFPRDVDEHPRFECPECSHDHSRWYAGMVVWGSIKEA